MGTLTYDLGLKTTLLAIVLIYLAILALFLILKSIKSPKEEKGKKEMGIAYGFFILSFIIARIFYIFSDYKFIANDRSITFYRYIFLAQMFIILAFLFIVYLAEKYILKKSRFILTIIIVIFLCIDTVILFFPENILIMRMINLLIIFIFEAGVLIVIYSYVGIKTTGEPRKKALAVLIAMFAIIIASIIDMEYFIMSGLTVPYFTPIIIAIGLTLFIYVFMK